MKRQNSSASKALSQRFLNQLFKTTHRSLLRTVLRAEQLEYRLALDASDPLSALLQAPDSNSQISISFNRPVTGVDLSDFALTHQDMPLELSSAQLDAINSQDYVLTLPELLSDGEYELQLLAENSGIVDETEPQIALLDDAMVNWTRDTLAPTLSINWTPPSIAEPIEWRLAALGDSQTTEAGNSYVPYLRQLLSSEEFSVSIFAEPGWQAPQVQGLWDSSVKDAGYDAAVFFAGVNDLISTDRSAEEIFGSLATMFNEALARNMPVVAVGVSPWSHYIAANAVKQTRTLQLNALMAQYADEHPSQVRFIDSQSALGSVRNRQRLSTRHDTGDGLHLSATGDQTLAGLIGNAIKELRPAVAQSASVTVSVSEPVTGLSDTDFRILRNGIEHASTAIALSPLEVRFDFEVPANDSAEYTIQWLGTEPIVDLYGNSFAGDVTAITQFDRQAPTAQLTLPQATISHEMIERINITFSEPVTGLSISDFQLKRGNQLIDLSEATLTELIVTELASSELTTATYQLELSDLAATSGAYRLVFAAGGSTAVKDLSGNALRDSAIAQWVSLVAEPTVLDGSLSISTTPQSETVELNVFSDHLELWISGLRADFSLQDIAHVQLSTDMGEDIVSIELIEEPEQLPTTPWLTIDAQSISQIAQLSLFGLAGDDIFHSTPAGITLSNSLLTAQALGFAVAHVYAGSTDEALGNDTATFTDSSATERLISRSTSSQWTAPTYVHWVHNFATVVANSSGGSDTATLYDSAGDDIYTGSHTQGQLNGQTTNGQATSVQVNAFPIVTINSSLGFDTATLTGSLGVDTFVAQSLSSALYGSGYRHNLNNFDYTQAIGNGGSDVATFYDSPATDSAELSPFNGRMTGAAFTNVATQFPRINAFSRFGADSVIMTGTSGNDTYSGQETSSSLVGAGYGLYAYRFASTTAVSAGGSDIAKLYDSTGDDRFDSTPTSSTLTAPTYSLTAQEFPTVYAYGRSGTDLAFLSGSGTAETYTGYTTYGVLVSGGRNQYAYGFDRVVASGGGGIDTATLYDSPDNDTLISALGQTELTGPGFQHVALGFTRTNSYSRAGFDIAELNGSTGNDQFSGQVNASFVTGGGVSNYAYGFDRVSSNGLGGVDIANIYDSADDDILVASSQTVSLQSGAFSNTASAYSRTNVYSRSGYDIATLLGTPDVETFSSQTTGSSIIGSGFANYAYAFDAIVAESAGGADIANLYDSPGDDMFIATSTSATLSGTGYRYTANGFSRVNAYGRSGNDMAMLIGSARSETVVVRPEYAYIKMSSYLNYAAGFDTVSISGGGGNDTAYLYDSVGNDQLLIGTRTAMILGSTFMASLDGFYRINAYASAGNDRVTLSDTLGNDAYTSRNNLGTLSSSGFTANLDSFDTVVLAPSIGGTNTLDIADLSYVLQVGLGWQ